MKTSIYNLLGLLEHFLLLFALHVKVCSEPINQNEPQISISGLSTSFQFLENNFQQTL